MDTLQGGNFKILSTPFWAGLCLALVTLSSCSSAPKTTTPGELGPVGTGPTAPGESGPPPPPSFGPDLPRDKGVVLVLGPGMTRSFYYAGLLRGLRDSRVPISGLVGLEAGALVAAVYATSATTSEFEWKMMKIKDGTFPRPAHGVGKWFSRAAGSRALRGEMETVFGAARMEDVRVPLKIGVVDVKTGEVRFVTAGLVADVVAASMAVSGLTPAVDFEGSAARAPLPERMSPVDVAKEMAPGLVLAPLVTSYPQLQDTSEQEYVDLLSASRKACDLEWKRADIAWSADLRGYSFFTLDGRRKLEGLGREDAKTKADEIKKRLLGGGSE